MTGRGVDPEPVRGPGPALRELTARLGHRGPAQDSPGPGGVSGGVTGGVPAWAPDPGRVVSVVAAHPGCGASTLALALATAAGCPARVVECASASASGLVAASTAELGVDAAGWARGRRDTVIVERVGEVIWSVGEVPPPTGSVVEVTVLDVAWEAGQVVGAASWLADQVATGSGRVVVVASMTVPGMRRLEEALALLGEEDRVVAALAGPAPGRRLARAVAGSTGPVTRHLDRAGRCVRVAWDRRLAVTGVDSAALPQALLTSARRLLTIPLPTQPPIQRPTQHLPTQLPGRSASRAVRAPVNPDPLLGGSGGLGGWPSRARTPRSPSPPDPASPSHSAHRPNRLILPEVVS